MKFGGLRPRDLAWEKVAEGLCGLNSNRFDEGPWPQAQTFRLAAKCPHPPVGTFSHLRRRKRAKADVAKYCFEIECLGQLENKSCKVNEDDVFRRSVKFGGLRPRDLAWEKVAEGRMRAPSHKLKHSDSRPRALIPLSGPSPICEDANGRRRMLLNIDKKRTACVTIKQVLQGE